MTFYPATIFIFAVVLSVCPPDAEPEAEILNIFATRCSEGSVGVVCVVRAGRGCSRGQGEWWRLLVGSGVLLGRLECSLEYY